MSRQGVRKPKPAVARLTSPRQISLGWLGGTVGYYLRTAQEAAFDAFARRANDAVARPWRFAILALIDANPGVTQGDLAAAIRRKTSTLTPALNELVRRGYVNRNRVKSDQRAYALSLTPRGREAMLELKASAVAHEREVDRLVGPENRSEFIRILRQVAEGLSERSSSTRRGKTTRGRRNAR
jgi:DNA-binding MarR family transcriptional regulator